MNDVVITGIGSVSPYSDRWDDFASRTDFPAPDFRPWPASAYCPREGAVIGQVESYDRKRYLTPADQRTADKFGALSVLAAGQALESAGILHDGALTVEADGVATIVGTSRPEFGGFLKFGLPVLAGQVSKTNPVLFPYMARSVACGLICITFGLRGYSTNLSAGPLSGLHAVARAWQLLRTGRAEIALAGGSECLSRDSLRNSGILLGDYFANAEPTFFGDETGLPVPAEGATFLIIETLESARRRGKLPLARITGAVLGRYHRDQPEEACADDFIDTVLPKCGLDWGDIGVISSGASGMGHPSDRLETALIAAAGRRHDYFPLVTACRSLTGDAEAGSSATQVSLAASALATGSVIPTLQAAVRSPLNVARRRQDCSPKVALVSGIDRSRSYAFIGMDAL